MSAIFSKLFLKVSANNGIILADVKIESRKYNPNTKSSYSIWGSGVLVADDIVITSAHVVYTPEYKTLNTDFKVIPATSNGSMPYGTRSVSQVVVNPEYLSALSLANDFAVLKLTSPLGKSAGYLKVSTQVSEGEFAQIAGYPQDRMGYMVHAADKIISVSDTKLQYTIDTIGGQSGSPILNANNEVIGIHNGAYPDSNAGARITNSRVDLINSLNPSSGQITPAVNTTDSSKPVYRLYNESSKRHHYTSDLNEKNTLVLKQGWKYEGIAWSTGDVAPVYRLYNPTTKDHLLTTNMNMVQKLQVSGWKNEGVAFQSGTGIDVFRLYSSVTKKHFYTASISEKDYLVNVVWRYEGVAFKAN